MNPITELLANMLQGLFGVYARLALTILRAGIVTLLVALIALALARR